MTGLVGQLAEGYGAQYSGLLTFSAVTAGTGTRLILQSEGKLIALMDDSQQLAKVIGRNADDGRILVQGANGEVRYLETTTSEAVALLEAPAVVGSARRYEPGVASWGGELRLVQEGQVWLRGTDGNAGKIPQQIAEQLAGKEFATFDDFRKAFWKAVSNDPVLSKQFTPGNQALMRKGLAPFAVETQQVGGRMRYELDHLDELQYGGNVYDMDNLVIRTLLNHLEGKP